MAHHCLQTTLPTFQPSIAHVPIIYYSIARLTSPPRRFLHTTYLGSKLVHLIWNAIAQSSYAAQGYPTSSPIRNATSIFWSIRTNDDGPRRDDHFHALVNTGKIELIAPNRAIGYYEGGVVLADGSKVAADTVILGTGYTSSWKGLFDGGLAL